MEMKRRAFNKLLASAVLFLAGGGWAWLRWLAPNRVVEALRTHRYPGPVRPLDESSILKPGTWNG
ncbi:MAG TPA: hypothetical protein DCZ95_18710 [Verrucomicrobia bacterium]|nr:hypothetical protein [Verrucomicrobiota bacterium]